MAGVGKSDRHACGGTVKLAFLLLALLNPAMSPAQLVYGGTTHSRVVALTFDAGADRGFAARILSVLESNRVHVSFGMTGLWAQHNSDLVRRMSKDGYTFINHTYDHRSFTGYSSRTAALTEDQRRWEITRTERIVHALTGKTTKPYFRPPFGDYDTATLSTVRSLGYRYSVMWTVDSLGWQHLAASAIVQRCMDHIKPGSIILMHVGIQSQDAIALPAVIRGLRRLGYRFATVPQLLATR